ncbi:DUF1543 domain-containing protein [Flavobacterium sp. '19STA2R22 D10 B1']|uniref:DUF1543 domain-containing protein n=1 Tax=Flavobacterium aerium TaxID=3037261 RepID=UPI00278BC516|nr:DUF1543 domain-containing protein [Flavobacterium sp. '19STA2R22 D10 B1']
MESPKLFMMMLGCKPEGRHTEQHDVFFSVANSLTDLKEEIAAFWPNSGKLHLDAWREVTEVNGYRISIVKKENTITTSKRLFFMNLGGYKPDEFDEFHYKMLVVANDLADAIHQAEDTAFYKHVGFAEAPSHVDDKYGVDVDDTFEILDILPKKIKDAYDITIEFVGDLPEDTIHLGYFELSTI